MRQFDALLLITVVHLATPARAQAQRATTNTTPGHTAIVDSAAVARRAFAEAASIAARSLGAALPSLLRASRAWPTQPSYWASTARVAARLNDTSALRESIAALSSMRVGAATLRDSAVWRGASSPALVALRDQWQQRTAPVSASQVAVTLADSTVFAEGIDADPVSGVLYVASIRHRTIFEVQPNGRIRDLNVGRAPRVGAILGVRVAPDRRTLYATTAGLRLMHNYTAADSSIGALLRINIADGTVEQRWDAPADSALHMLGDLAIDEHGTVYISDSFAPNLYRVRAGERTITTLSHPLFRSLQGIAVLPGSRALIVADYSYGLLHVEVDPGLSDHPDREHTDEHNDARTRPTSMALRVTRIADAPSTTTLGIDGVVWHDGSIIAVQNGVEPPRVMRFTLDDTHQRITRADILDRRPDIADEPTIGTLWRGGFVYVANSQWEKYDDAGARRAGTTLRPTQLLCIPLGDAPQRTAIRTQAAVTADGVATTASTGRNGTRNTDSAPPSARSCSVSDAASP